MHIIQVVSEEELRLRFAAIGDGNTSFQGALVQLAAGKQMNYQGVVMAIVAAMAITTPLIVDLIQYADAIAGKGTVVAREARESIERIVAHKRAQ